MSRTDTFARTRADGILVEVLPDGTEQPFPGEPVRPMTEAEVAAAAAGDPDARPMTDDEFRAARRVPRAKTLRRALGLTREEFAARFGIPLRALSDWEEGRAEPDETARSYLRAIAGDAEGVRRALDVGGGLAA